MLLGILQLWEEGILPDHKKMEDKVVHLAYPPGKTEVQGPVRVLHFPAAGANIFKQDAVGPAVRLKDGGEELIHKSAPSPQQNLGPGQVLVNDVQQGIGSARERLHKEAPSPGIS
jgi:hypothetical protein